MFNNRSAGRPKELFLSQSRWKVLIQILYGLGLALLPVIIILRSITGPNEPLVGLWSIQTDISLFKTEQGPVLLQFTMWGEIQLYKEVTNKGEKTRKLIEQGRYEVLNGGRLRILLKDDVTGVNQEYIFDYQSSLSQLTLKISTGLEYKCSRL